MKKTSAKSTAASHARKKANKLLKRKRTSAMELRRKPIKPLQKKKVLVSKPKKNGADKLKNKLIPLGDPESSLLKWEDGTDASIRKFAPSQIPNPNPPTASESFLENQQLDLDFMPLDGATRRARANIARNMVFQINGKIIRRDDPVEVDILKLQQVRGQAHLLELQQILGKKANWRDMLVLQARESPTDKKELSQRLISAFFYFNTIELKKFVEAAERAKKFKAEIDKLNQTPDQTKDYRKTRLALLEFGLQFEAKEGKLPTKADGEIHAMSKGLPWPKGPNESKILWQSPYLSLWQRAKEHTKSVKVKIQRFKK
jgi:hypothetical protein